MAKPRTSDLLDMDLVAGPDAWRPTDHGRFLGQVLAQHDLVAGKRLLELGAGLGNHTIVLLRKGAAHVTATEISEPLLATTRANVERNCPGQENIEYRVADWLSTPGTFEVIVANPPFCKSGKQNRRYFIDALILDAHKRLEPGGHLVFVQSSMADLDKTKARLNENGFKVEVLSWTEGPFRDYYFEDETFLQEITEVENGFQVRDGEYYETLYVLRAELQPFTPPAGAHVV